MKAENMNTEFEQWLSRFRTHARRQGISETVLDMAFDGVRYASGIIEKDRNQSEFIKPIWEYLDSAVSEARVRNGQQALRDNRDMLDAIDREFGVEKEVFVAIWGLESAYGTIRGDENAIAALASLAFDGRRRRLFETQLIAALKIVQSGDVKPDEMTGSWAGAMGHTQFMPTSYLAYAVDFDGDGKRGIWSDNPTDALASTAAYLARFGWTKGQPWGVEVQLPDGFDYTQSGHRVKKDVAEWMALGVRDIAGKTVGTDGPARVLLPAGACGAAFLVFQNFHVILRYNAADAYVIGVGHLADRIAGASPIQAAWPTGDRPLSFSEMSEMQKRLTAAGFDTDGADGMIGPNTVAAIRAFQMSRGVIPDGYASYEILRQLK
ncbi:MAG: lytic murein transglycosylase [Marinosulfonomonas sp.]